MAWCPAEFRLKASSVSLALPVLLYLESLGLLFCCLLLGVLDKGLGFRVVSGKVYVYTWKYIYIYVYAMRQSESGLGEGGRERGSYRVP